MKKRITYELQGECNRNGACCRALKCEHLGSEIHNGKEQAVCKLHGTFWHPYGCVNYPPNPTDVDLQEGCGFSWKIVKEEIT